MTNLINDFKNWAKEDKKSAQKLVLLKHREQILALLDEGFSIKLIYKYFIEHKLITCGYDNFRKHINNLKINYSIANDKELKDKISKQKHKTLMKRQKQQEDQKKQNLKPGDPDWKPKIVKAEIPRFEWNSTPDINELV